MFSFRSPKETGLTLDSFIDMSPIAIVRLDEQGVATEGNPAFHSLTRNIFQITTNLKLIEVLEKEDQPKLAELIEKTYRGNPSPDPVSLTIKLENIPQIIVSTYATLMKVVGNDKPVLVLHLIDQTEQKNLEMRFAHSQKMQAVGQLAGGVAHDFNNLLTAMIGFCDLLLMRHPAGDPSFADIMQIKQNANRAANLVRQLLAFSRRQTLQPKTIDLTDVIAELSNLIRRLIGENITLNVVHGRDLGMVKADQGQLEQVIINLAVNARDAMTEGGSLTLRTSNVSIARMNGVDPSLRPPTEEENIAPGDYVLVEVEDTGCGIPLDIIQKIFEPFFSTKEVGSGTGLGLATVYGIVKQTGGYVYVRSEVGKGTTFCLFFKRHAAEVGKSVAAEAGEDAKMADLTGKATILLVEDETPVRIFAARALRNKGYEVLEADCADSAIQLFEQHSGQIEVIISDVVMPGMNGPKMIQELETRFPQRMAGSKVIFISGYAEDAFVDTFGTSREFNFLPKPFTLKQLASKVKDVTTGAAGTVA